MKKKKNGSGGYRQQENQKESMPTFSHPPMSLSSSVQAQTRKGKIPKK